MQEKLTIARPYALAAFGYAQGVNEVPAWSAMLDVLAVAVSHSDLKPLIRHPLVSNEQLCDLLTEMMGSHLDANRTNFLRVLLDAERLELAPEIAELFERHKAAAEGVVDVRVESAYEMSAGEQDRIASAIRTRVGKECEVTAEVDSDLIGGAVIKVGDSVIDISLRGRLRALEQRLT
ncbi:MAG: F0F1 ATP synthase subunit delta [Gammaproteobacteria bacterium]|jgi:F-type H+-transporting ATPase subunit delta|nr:F0F1 ATP synthase subunit delta [Gammaproteobacteria bacterium]